MLSSGTLNLKFMQRNNNDKNNNLKTKIELTPSSNLKSTGSEQLTTRNYQDTTADLTKGKHKSSDLSSSIHLDQNLPPTCTVIYEESLIHFPFLYSTRSASCSPLNITLPVHLGRTSFGHSIKSTEKPEKPSSTHKRTKPDSSTSQNPEKRHKKLKTKSQDSLSSCSKSNPHEPYQDRTSNETPSSSKSNERILHTISEDKKREPGTKTARDEPSQVGFKKPFNSTTIKSKRQSATGMFAASRDLRTSPPSKPTKIVESTKPNNSQQHENIITGDDESGDSDNTEMVKSQIEMMFKEARKAQIAARV